MKKSERIEERYNNNIALLPKCSDYIFSQNAARYKELRFSDKGSVGVNGCGAVAVHNVMKYIGCDCEFCDVLRDMEKLDLPWLKGLFGTKPWALGRYFRQHKIPYQKYSSPVEFKEALLTHPIGIVCTWNKRFYGMHFFCIYYSADEKQFYSANFRSAGARFRPTPIDEINNTRFVVGYTVGAETI